MNPVVIFYLAIALVVLIMSVVLHEVAHGWVALKLGDDTAKEAGRLTLNPLPHLHWFGSVILPAMLMLLGNFVFGYAKPVPFREERLRSYKLGPIVLDGGLCVSLAGVTANFLIALAFGLTVRSMPWNGIYTAIGLQGAYMLKVFLESVVNINLVLAIFNLLPIPPLDGWRVWGSLLTIKSRLAIEHNANAFLILLFVLSFLLPQLILGPIFWVVKFFFVLFTGAA